MQMFGAAFFTIARRWKQPKFLSADEWINKIVYLYNGILFDHEMNEGADACYSIHEY